MSVTAIPILTDLQGPWREFRMELVGPDGTEERTMTDIFPITSVADLKRMLWLQQEGDPRWAPEHVFLGVRSGTDRIRPIEFHWPIEVMGAASIDLLDPTRIAAADRTPNPALTDATGRRKPVSAIMTGGFILETALSPEILSTGAVPVLTAISLAALVPTEAGDLTPALFNGFYRLYFPWLNAAEQVLDAPSTTRTPEMIATLTAAAPYIDDRLQRIGVVQKALERGVAGDAVAMKTMVRLRWVLPPPPARPESLEKTFYGLHATAAIPFLRFFPAQGRGASLLKLGLQEDGTPIVSNEKVFAAYMNTPAPNMESAVILARIPMDSTHVERGAAFTLYMFEDGTTDITLEVPQRGATYAAAVATDAERLLGQVIQTIGYPADTQPILRDVHATYSWSHPEPRRAAALSAARIQSRVEVLTPFLDVVPTVEGGTALASFVWRAVSNYEHESIEFAYITQLVLRKSSKAQGAEALKEYKTDIATKFGITEDAAEDLLGRWLSRRKKAVAPAAGPGAGSLAVPKHSTGTILSVTGAHPEYQIEIQGADSIQEVQRALSVVGVLLGASSADLTLRAPTPAATAAAAAIVVEDAAVEETVAAAAGAGVAEAVDDVMDEELDPALLELMGGLGYAGFGADAADVDIAALPTETEMLVPPGATAAAAAALEAAVTATTVAAEETAGATAPDLDAAMAEVEEECRGIRWKEGEPALKMPADWYMARLRAADKKLFGYTATERSAAFSKSCQRRDDRQPNIMSLAQYSRILRCYEGRIRFVNLPPRKPSDLPVDPAYDPKRVYPDEYYLTDPETGLPMWTVYNYENKTRPGEFNYVMCAEYWCDRDNLPLLESEFRGTEGRGFEKPPNTCPFCGGAAFADMAKPRPGESVIIRKTKGATMKRHRFIGIIRQNRHPEGWALPCCDTTPRLLQEYLTAAVTGRLVMGRELDLFGDKAAAAAAAAAEAEEDAEPPPEMLTDAAGAGVGEGEEVTIDYRQKLGSMHTQYILDGDKALEAGKIGLLPPLLDTFFGQTSERAVERVGIRKSFVPGVTLFLRVGVDTRARAPGLNLFAGLAPLMDLESAEQTQREFLSKRMVRAFESANYGTLVQEFAARATITTEEIVSSLPAFAAEFGYSLDTNRAHVIRLYKAWHAFLQYIRDTKRPKQLRHFEHLLAQPGVVLPRGLLLVVLEQSGDSIQVACPSFGIPTASVFGDVPIGFIWHNKRDESWEPLVLYNGTKDAVRLFNERSPALSALPPPVRGSIQQWLREWRTASLGCGRPAPPPHVWTPDRDTRGLPRLYSLLARTRDGTVSKLVRDRSNRLAGVLLRMGSATAAAGAGAAGNEVFVPCLDDGALADTIPRIFEADTLPLAPLEIYLSVYEERLTPEYPALRPVRLLFRKTEETGDQHVVGFATEAGTMIPVAPMPLDTLEGLPADPIDAFPWERDALILRSPDSPPASAGTLAEEDTASVEEQLAEAYQYLRLSLSMWLTRDALGPTLRTEVGRLLTSKLPLYEKRKRMDILLEPYIRRWVFAEQTTERKALSLLRADCLSLKGDACSAQSGCRWSGERCLIHAPHREEGTDPVRIFTARMSDELLRYANQRDEILQSKVPEFRTPRGIVRAGRELFLATREFDTATTVMERLGFLKRTDAVFPEELLRFDGMEEEPPAVAVVEAVTEGTVSAAPTAASVYGLPPSWRELGLTIPTPPAGLEDARRLSFAGITGRSIEEWERFIQLRRQKLRLPGDVTRPFQWSIQDFFVIAAIKMANQIFVRVGADGKLQITRWIAPPTATGGPTLAKPLYMVYWGPQELLVSHGKNYVFFAKDLPIELLNAMDITEPMAEDTARGSLTAGMEEEEESEGESTGAEEAPLVTEMEALAVTSAPESESKEEGAPELVVTEVA